MNEQVKAGQAEHKKTTGCPLVLAIDTSTAVMAASLMEGERVLGELNSMSERNHSVYSVASLQQLLKQAGKSHSELDAIIVGCGPGSYTGMRIAVTIGKTLAWVWNKPLVSVSSLEGLAYGALQRAAGDENVLRWVIPLMDARRGQVYTAAFAAGTDGQWERVASDGIRLMADWADELARLVKDGDGRQLPQEIIFAGELELHQEQADRFAGMSGSLKVLSAAYTLEGSHIARLGQDKLHRGELSAPHTLVPNYTQLAEAEVKLLAARGGEVQPRV
ncbi:tRNA (adenosine(37)-N6)-threonylcarbamoyltransferase complex dimerization subunit type 1 TsaB [Paenibacillus pinihumi]|uniref:tRNA (adenosine(37)-N6)-threonylcarbamoyltransferase complex dimerization subunit type 1 TsaB n=1 Tax=Paenibacillus pinihumi TaxID=669462 RepID=UPI000409A531|nr:tRNA (adenosine(37)-N6)-threonylcarbamoyltransferase complex dimerization subunit type 1 TsaB [Paenibacillus pinihumi]